MADAHSIGHRLERIFWADPDVVRYAIWVSVWGRWFVGVVGIAMLAHRSNFWFPDYPALWILMVLLVTFNGFVHYWLQSNRTVTWRCMLALSAFDIALITGNVTVGGSYFVAYYPALALFAVVFPSLWLILAWVTATGLVYCLVVVVAGPSLGLDVAADYTLGARLSVAYLITVCVSLVVGFERTRRKAATESEHQAQQERIELSQEIHDTTAQTAYLIGLGIEGAMRVAGDSNPRLMERLEATAALSRSAMWELRRPIDLGQLFEGRELGRVLGSHTATFAKITAVPVEMVQSGDEPALPPGVRTCLFSIAHNALTNAFLHAQARKVEVGLNFEPDLVSLSVSDDGIGLPEDYAERGRGFGGMQADAVRMGGRLVVESGGPGKGTTITCLVPAVNQKGG